MSQYTQAVQNLYIAYFSRPADPGGLHYWEEVATRTHGDFSALRNAFSHSTEYLGDYANKNNYELVDQVYQNLFGRHAELGGLQYWGNLLDQKAISVDNVVEFVAAGARGSDLVALNLKSALATKFTDTLEAHPGGTSGYHGAHAAEVAKLLLGSVTDDMSFQNVVAPNGFLDQAIGIISGDAQPMGPVVWGGPLVTPILPAPVTQAAAADPTIQLTGTMVVEPHMMALHVLMF